MAILHSFMNIPCLLITLCKCEYFFFYFKTVSILFFNQQWWVGETGLVNIFRVGEMGVGKMGQIIGEMGVGKMGVIRR